jgi:hypothetical protein
MSKFKVFFFLSFALTYLRASDSRYFIDIADYFVQKTFSPQEKEDIIINGPNNSAEAMHLAKLLINKNRMKADSIPLHNVVKLSVNNGQKISYFSFKHNDNFACETISQLICPCPRTFSSEVSISDQIIKKEFPSSSLLAKALNSCFYVQSFKGKPAENPFTLAAHDELNKPHDTYNKVAGEYNKMYFLTKFWYWLLSVLDSVLDKMKYTQKPQDNVKQQQEVRMTSPHNFCSINPSLLPSSYERDNDIPVDHEYEAIVLANESCNYPSNEVHWPSPGGASYYLSAINYQIFDHNNEVYMIHKTYHYRQPRTLEFNQNSRIVKLLNEEISTNKIHDTADYPRHYVEIKQVISQWESVTGLIFNTCVKQDLTTESCAMRNIAEIGKSAVKYIFFFDKNSRKIKQIKRKIRSNDQYVFQHRSEILGPSSSLVKKLNEHRES